nr:transcription initiation factor TFIID subunit 4-like [Anser cygnoides]
MGHQARLQQAAPDEHLFHLPAAHRIKVQKKRPKHSTKPGLGYTPPPYPAGTFPTHLAADTAQTPAPDSPSLPPVRTQTRAQVCGPGRCSLLPSNQRAQRGALLPTSFALSAFVPPSPSVPLFPFCRRYQEPDLSAPRRAAAPPCPALLSPEAAGREAGGGAGPGAPSALPPPPPPPPPRPVPPPEVSAGPGEAPRRAERGSAPPASGRRPLKGGWAGGSARGLGRRPREGGLGDRPQGLGGCRAGRAIGLSVRRAMMASCSSVYSPLALVLSLACGWISQGWLGFLSVFPVAQQAVRGPKLMAGAGEKTPIFDLRGGGEKTPISTEAGVRLCGPHQEQMLWIDFPISFSAASFSLKCRTAEVQPAEFHKGDATTPYWRAPDIATARSSKNMRCALKSVPGRSLKPSTCACGCDLDCTKRNTGSASAPQTSPT